MPLTNNQLAFLTAYKRLGVITTAAEKLGITREAHYQWLDRSDEYKAAFAAAREEAIERLEAEVRKRAESGDEEIVTYKGAICFEPLRDASGKILHDEQGKPLLSDQPLTIRRKSDLLAMFLLKSMRPHTYRDNAQVQLTGPQGAPLEIEVVFRAPDKRSE